MPPHADPPDRVTLEDQSLRDGLQNERRLLGLDEKLEIVRLLAEAGFRRVQIGSFVNPRKVPQMAETEELVRRVHAGWPQLRCSALVLNAKGLDRAMACGMRHLSLSISISDTHSRKNAGCGATEALAAMTMLVRRAADRGIAVRAGVQCAFGCAEEKRIPGERVVAAARQLVAAGAVELNLADTAGMAQPLQVGQLVAQVRDAVPAATLSLHLHDAGGVGVANLRAGYEAGVRLFDVCVGGLGGCPFVRDAAGNVAAEEAVRLFAGMGVATGIDLSLLLKATARYAALLGRPLPDAREGRLHPAGD